MPKSNLQMKITSSNCCSCLVYLQCWVNYILININNVVIVNRDLQDYFCFLNFRNMSGFGLRGTLPRDSFTSLTALTSLDVYNNFLMSPLPSMSMLTQLHDLYVKFNLLMEDTNKFYSFLTPITWKPIFQIIHVLQLVTDYSL